MCYGAPRSDLTLTLTFDLDTIFVFAGGVRRVFGYIWVLLTRIGVIAHGMMGFCSPRTRRLIQIWFCTLCMPDIWSNARYWLSHAVGLSCNFCYFTMQPEVSRCLYWVICCDRTSKQSKCALRVYVSWWCQEMTRKELVLRLKQNSEKVEKTSCESLSLTLSCTDPHIAVVSIHRSCKYWTLSLLLFFGIL